MFKDEVYSAQKPKPQSSFKAMRPFLFNMSPKSLRAFCNASICLLGKKEGYTTSTTNGYSIFCIFFKF